MFKKQLTRLMVLVVTDAILESISVGGTLQGRPSRERPIACAKG
jgi:hypothetical protein